MVMTREAPENMQQSTSNRQSTFHLVLFGLAATVLVAGCDSDAAEPGDVEFRAQPDHSCTNSLGEIGQSCNGNDCPVELDIEISCPDDDAAQGLQLGLTDKRVWGSFNVSGNEPRAFRIQGKGNGLTWLDSLPGRGFAGQAVDGTLYRFLDGPAYLRGTNSGWDEVPVLGLPNDYYSFEGFHVRPDGEGGLHASFQTGEESGAFRFATQAEDESWSWSPLGSWDPNVGGSYVGKDAWDRTHSLVHTGDWEDGPQILLRFSHFGINPVGESGEMGKIANPPRPELGGDAPIATLRRFDDIHKLLSIVDGDDWTETPIAGTEPLSGLCPIVYNANDPACPPCHSEGEGVEDDAYQLTRTSGGQLWGAWFVTEAVVDMAYTAVPRGTKWRCVGTPSTEASGTLHLVELGADGSAGRSLALEFDDVGLRSSGDGGQRELGIAAYDDRVALLLPTFPLDEGVNVRVMVVDTDEIE